MSLFSMHVPQEIAPRKGRVIRMFIGDLFVNGLQSLGGAAIRGLGLAGCVAIVAGIVLMLGMKRVLTSPKGMLITAVVLLVALGVWFASPRVGRAAGSVGKSLAGKAAKAKKTASNYWKAARDQADAGGQALLGMMSSSGAGAGMMPMLPQPSGSISVPVATIPPAHASPGGAVAVASHGSQASVAHVTPAASAAVIAGPNNIPAALAAAALPAADTTADQSEGDPSTGGAGPAAAEADKATQPSATASNASKSAKPTATASSASKAAQPPATASKASKPAKPAAVASGPSSKGSGKPAGRKPSPGSGAAATLARRPQGSGRVQVGPPAGPRQGPSAAQLAQMQSRQMQSRQMQSRQMQAHIANMQVQQMWNQHMMYIHQAMGGYHAGAGYGAHPGMGLHNGGLGQVHPGHHGGR
jgi:hypothetical protein